MACAANKQWLTSAIVLTIAASFSSFSVWSLWTRRRKSVGLESRIRELEISLKASLEKSAAERQGRIRAQQALRRKLEQNGSDKSQAASFPLTPTATVQSCFSTRNGTPRQPLIVPLAQACLLLDPVRAPPEALEGLAEYSHCWILYIFLLNTDLDKLWNEPSRSKLKAKVRVPRLKGRKMGVLATRSPHRPRPIGLTVAKVEAVHGRVVFLSGVDLVDGTSVLDIKPYLPYSDSIQGATIPKWVMADSSLATTSVEFSPEFRTTLSSCWATVDKFSLYASVDEFQSLIKQVLSWDIRSVSQQNRPCRALPRTGILVTDNRLLELEDSDANSDVISGEDMNGAINVAYHLVLEGVDVSYRIDSCSNVIVQKAAPCENIKSDGFRCNYTMWSDTLAC